MTVTVSYHDICREIDILEIRIDDLEGEYHFWLKACHRGGFPLDTCLERMKKICDQVEAYTKILKEKEKARKEIEKRISEFEGLEWKIAYMRDIQGMTLAEIAADLGYSYIWVRQLYSRTKRKHTKNIHSC